MPYSDQVRVGSTPPDYETDATIQTITVTCHQDSGRNSPHIVTVTIQNVLESKFLKKLSPQSKDCFTSSYNLRNALRSVHVKLNFSIVEIGCLLIVK